MTFRFSAALDQGELGDLPMPAPYRKALHAVMRAADFQLEA